MRPPVRVCSDGNQSAQTSTIKNHFTKTDQLTVQQGGLCIVRDTVMLAGTMYHNVTSRRGCERVALVDSDARGNIRFVRLHYDLGVLLTAGDGKGTAIRLLQPRSAYMPGPEPKATCGKVTNQLTATALYLAR